MGTIDGCQGTAERCSRTEPGRYCPPQSSVLPRSAGSFPCSRTERLCDRQHTRHMSPSRLPCFGRGRCRECRKGKKKRGLPRKLLQVAVGIDSQGGVLLRLGSRGLQGQAIQWMPSSDMSHLVQSSTTTWDTSVAASPDAPQERSAMAVGECVPEGAGKGSVLQHIQDPLLQRDLPFRKALRRWDVYQHEQQLCLSFFKE